MATDIPVVHMAYANPDLRRANIDLVHGIADAERNRETVPCRENPAAFTSDLLAFKTAQSRLLANTSAMECLDSCPVLALCRRFADEQFADRKSPSLYGVIAGRLVIGRQHYTLGLSARPTRPKELTHA